MKVSQSKSITALGDYQVNFRLSAKSDNSEQLLVLLLHLFFCCCCSPNCIISGYDTGLLKSSLGNCGGCFKLSKYVYEFGKKKKCSVSIYRIGSRNDWTNWNAVVNIHINIFCTYQINGKVDTKPANYRFAWSLASKCLLCV